MNERNVVGWFEIYVEDMGRAKKFYEAVFDIQLEDLKMEGIEMWSFPGDPDKPGCNGSLVKMQGMSPSGISTMVYFSSEDCSIEEKRISENGGTIEKPKESIGKYGFITLAKDTEGNMIGIHSLK